MQLGESVWVPDPVLIKKYTKDAQVKGWSESEIQKGIANHDWLGFRIECRAIVSVKTSGGSAGDVIKVSGAQWVLNEYSGDFYEHVKGNYTEN